jgi:uncharacterized protein YndB with AHSA1/START domain
VFAALLNIGNYPQWWPSKIRFRFYEPGQLKTGSRIRIFNGPFVKWTATVLEIIPNRLIRFSYGEGAWTGDAQWILQNREGKTEVVYEIAIYPAQAWLRCLARLLDLGKLHSREMVQILQSLKRMVET